ncbi:acyltransferase family protein [Streptomyces sp. NPDC101132]|uniref:acyltransferase family protein n=1 Tax=Streptomyces sp. NPDC101132 TaxID=3366110 RepID=UPI00381D5CFF
MTTSTVSDLKPAAGRAGAPPGRATIIPARRPSRLYVLDGLRLVAALAVVLYHLAGYDRYGVAGVWGASTEDVFPLLHRFAQYGWLGVELFFLISGFVICMSCWGRNVRDFAVSRVVRLFPAFWFCVLATAVAMRLSGDTGMTASRVLTNLTMLHEPLKVPHVDPSYWSLWAEMRFYVLFGGLLVWGLTYRRVMAFCGIWMLGSVLAPVSGIPLLVVMFQPQYAPFFIGGVLIFLMYRFGTSPLLWLMLGGSWLLAQHQLLTLVRGAEAWSRVEVSWTAALVLVTAFYGVLLAAALGRLNFFNRAWLVPAGALTYPLYLLHERLGWFAVQRLHGTVPPLALLAGLITVLLAASWAVHRFVERPLGLRLRRWLATGLEKAGPSRRRPAAAP